MLLFVGFFTMMIGVLFGAGYSHYRYRVRNNRYYERLFAVASPVAPHPEVSDLPTYNAYAFPALTLAMICLLLPVSLSI
jgi:hypothetical protein